MATYNTAFGSLPGYNEMLGTTNTTGGGQQQVYGQRAQQQRQGQAAPAPAQTFAQLQQRGMARPAPVQGPQAQPFAQYGGSQQAAQMRQRLQEQLAAFGNQPSRYDTQAFQQIRGAQAANLQAEYQGQQKALNEELARRGLSASSVGGGRMGDLAGQQARALASLDAQMLQQAAETQAADRAQLLQAGQGLAELAGSQDLAQFEANRVAQAATFENQLRAAQFGQQQYEQAGQEALQGAQAEEAAQQAARQFDLQATGQAAGLSMDLQRLLGQQELERAQLTGTLGGQQTLAGQQFGEQQRQFNIQQALQQQLGLGGLGLQQQEFGLKQQQFQQQIQDTAAERALREKLQTQELTAQEQQQLREIDARKVLQTQQLDQELKQFGLTLDETQKARAQQGGFTAQEIALKSRQVEQEGALQGRQLTLQERQNEVLNVLERDKLNADVNFRSQQLGLNRAELDMRAAQIKQDQLLRGTEITNEQAYRTAELGMRTTQIQNEFLRSGQQITLDEARLKAQKDIADADRAAQTERLTKQLAQEQSQFTVQQFGTATPAAGQQTLSRLQQNLQQAQVLSQITGKQYTVDASGNLVPGGGTATEAARQFNVESMLRQALGMSEASGYVYDPITGVRTSQETVAGQVARNQMFLTLAQLLQNTDLANALKGIAPSGTTSTTSTTSTNTGSPTDAAAAGQQPVGGTTYPVGQNFQDKYGYVWTKTSTGWVLKSSPSTSGTTSTTTTTDEISKAPANATEGQTWTSATGKTYKFTNGSWVLQTGTTSTTSTSGDYYKTAASGATVPADALSVLSNITSPNPTGVYMTSGKYWQNAGAGWYEVTYDSAVGKWVKI